MAYRMRSNVVQGLSRRVQSYSTSSPLERQHSLPASYYRGGTSRALFFHRRDLPPSTSEWAPIFLGCLGSPDPYGRQLDGMGGGISSLSKVCVVGPSSRPDADVDFTFAAVGVDHSEVDLGASCGNMTSAVGLWAVDEGVVRVPGNALAPEGEKPADCTVRIFNTNTSKIIHARFPVLLPSAAEPAEAASSGSFAIDGVAGSGAKIQLDFVNPSGSKTGKLLPTGNTVEVIRGKVATCIDVGNPAVFVRAADFGVHGQITPSEIEGRPGLLEELGRVRCEAAVRMGVAADVESVPGGYPKISLVGPPPQAGVGFDVSVRSISVGQPHRAIPITSALAVAAAAEVHGSIVHQCLSRQRAADGGLTIGHASGQLMVSATFDDQNRLLAATVLRTARRLMKGTVFWKPDCESATG